METTQDSITTKIIATIDLFGMITFRNCESIEGIGIKDDFGNYYDAGIDENFTVIGSAIDSDNTIYTGENGDEKIPMFKHGQKLLLLTYYNNADNPDEGLEVQGIFDNWKSFSESEAYEQIKYSKQYVIFIPVNQFLQTGWNCFLFNI